jgi:hypothetical protein
LLELTSCLVQLWDIRRNYSSLSEPDLKETMKRVIPAKRELLKKVKLQSDKKLGDVKVENALGGMRYDSFAYVLMEYYFDSLKEV